LSKSVSFQLGSFVPPIAGIVCLIKLPLTSLEYTLTSWGKSVIQLFELFPVPGSGSPEIADKTLLILSNGVPPPCSFSNFKFNLFTYVNDNFVF